MARAKIDTPVREEASRLEARARYFRVFGDPTRLRILEALLKRERSVSELMELAEAPQSRVSNHLACLKWCRLVEAERRGRQVFYRISDRRVAEMFELSRTLSPQHCDHLAGCRRIGPDWI